MPDTEGGPADGDAAGTVEDATTPTSAFHRTGAALVRQPLSPDAADGEDPLAAVAATDLAAPGVASDWTLLAHATDPERD